MTHHELQPFLHTLVTVVRAPVVALSPSTGDLAAGADGCYVADRRLLSDLEITLDGETAASVDAVTPSASVAEFLGVFRHVGDQGPDPTVFLERVREVSAEGMVETVRVASDAREPVEATLQIHAACDLASMHDVKAGSSTPILAGCLASGGWTWSGSDGSRVSLAVSLPADEVAEACGALRWRVRLGRGDRFTVVLRLSVEDDPSTSVGLPATGTLGEGRLRVQGHSALDAFLRRSLEDVDALTLADPEAPEDRYVAAGAPWYLTLFGRDSLWAARLLLPTGTALAGGTLRVLARRQGLVTRPETEEEPGKIIHEIRIPRGVGAAGTGTVLPPLYYGTVDATPLWVILLYDAWRWGLPEPEVRSLMPAAARAMAWLRGAANSHGGFVAYNKTTGQGLSNQGWKDSADAIQFRDGRLAEAPIALCEVQGYAYAAAMSYATLSQRLGLGDEDGSRLWARGLAERFRASYWISDDEGGYPATAIDASGDRVDTVTSNIGHLLGTGLLSDNEEALVVARLAAPSLDSGFGLRTLSTASAGYNPLSYHAGSVWPHDTAIAVGGLASVGSLPATATAARLAQGLIEAAATFDWRIPELYGGHSRTDRPAPAPYPAACRPQAWSAASAVAVVSAALGIDPDVPGGVVRIRPLSPWPFGDLRVEGIRVGGERLDLAVDGAGLVNVIRAPGTLHVDVG